MESVLEEVERYCDAVPRGAAQVEEHGSLRLFVREGPGFPYYGRPAGGDVTVADVLRVRDRQRALGVPEAFEWIGELAPTMRDAVEATGLAVAAYPLMVLEAGPEANANSQPPPPLPKGVTLRIISPDDPVLAPAIAVPRLAFGEAAAAGPADVIAKALELTADGTIAAAADRIRTGATIHAAALLGGAPLSAGQHSPVDGVTELAGIGTLPQARRRGLGLAVTAALVAQARADGVRTVFLSAADASVARLYARLGFRTRGTAMIAGPPSEQDSSAVDQVSGLAS